MSKKKSKAENIEKVNNEIKKSDICIHSKNNRDADELFQSEIQKLTAKKNVTHESIKKKNDEKNDKMEAEFNSRQNNADEMTVSEDESWPLKIKHFAHLKSYVMDEIDAILEQNEEETGNKNSRLEMDSTLSNSNAGENIAVSEPLFPFEEASFDNLKIGLKLEVLDTLQGYEETNDETENDGNYIIGRKSNQVQESSWQSSSTAIIKINVSDLCSTANESNNKNVVKEISELTMEDINNENGDVGLEEEYYGHDFTSQNAIIETGDVGLEEEYYGHDFTSQNAIIETYMNSTSDYDVSELLQQEIQKLMEEKYVTHERDKKETDGKCKENNINTIYDCNTAIIEYLKTYSSEANKEWNEANLFAADKCVGSANIRFQKGITFAKEYNSIATHITNTESDILISNAENNDELNEINTQKETESMLSDNSTVVDKIIEKIFANKVEEMGDQSISNVLLGEDFEITDDSLIDEDISIANVEERESNELAMSTDSENITLDEETIFVKQYNSVMTNLINNQTVSTASNDAIYRLDEIIKDDGNYLIIVPPLVNDNSENTLSIGNQGSDTGVVLYEQLGKDVIMFDDDTSIPEVNNNLEVNLTSNHITLNQEQAGHSACIPTENTIPTADEIPVFDLTTDEERPLLKTDDNIKSRKCTHTEKDQHFFKCRTCGLKYKYEGTYRKHQNEGHAKKACYLCDKVFLSHCHLKYHMESIHQVLYRPFVCAYKDCNKSFKMLQHKKQHIKNAHNGLKSIPCNNCYKTYDTQDDLKEHMIKKHTARIFRCYCGKEFKKNRYIKKHFSCCQTINNKNCKIVSYLCGICQKEMNPNDSTMAKHTMLKHYGEGITGFTVCFGVSTDISRTVQ